MRTTTFQRVFDKVIRWHGLNPAKTIPPDLARTVVERINDRVRLICNAWPWPEWTLTEERAFRQIWNSTDAYLRVSTTDGLPDEVFYLGAGFSAGGELGTGFGYYRVLSSAPSDPPAGTVPTNTTYWEAITPVDTYIAYDQRCRRSIGEVIGIYTRNPQSPACCNGNGTLKFMPSNRGIEVRCAGNPTTFITYKMPVPEYTIIPYVVGKTYARADIVFDPTTGECFQALAATSTTPDNVTFWRRVPFLTKWENYVCSGAFSDSMLESDQAGDADLQQRVIKAQAADERATMYLQSEVDALTVQGQVLKWQFKRRYAGWCCSQPWSGGHVSMLTEACQDELGWVYPSTSPVACDTSYHSEIVAILTATDTPSLEGLDTTTRAITCTLIRIVIDVDGSDEEQSWRLDSGPATVDGQVTPSDYNASTNDKHWTQVS